MEFLGLAVDMWKDIGLAAAILVLSAVTAWLVVQILDRLIARFTRHTGTGFDDAIYTAVRPPVFWGILLIGLRMAVSQLGFLPADTADLRDGIFWVLHTGAPWRDLPERYGPWSTVYDRFRRWRIDGTWQQIVDALQSEGRRLGRIDFDFAAMDGSVVRAHKSASGAEKGD